MDFSSNDIDPELNGLFVPFLPSFPTTIEPSQLVSSPSAGQSSPSSSQTSSPSRMSSPSGSESDTSCSSKRQKHDGHIKRHQTKLACTWCRKLSKKCDTQRPCGRCVQFNRCSECVDAPPRKPRAKGVDRGTYKKTRDLAVVNYEEAVTRREAYVAKMERKGKHVKVGLTADEILVAARKEDEKHRQEVEMDLNLPPRGQEVVELLSQPEGQELEMNLDPRGIQDQGGLPNPFGGPLEDLFTCSASPEPDCLDSPASESLDSVSSDSLESATLSFDSSAPSSPALSLFDEVSSPTTSSVTDYDESDFAHVKWSPLKKFPVILDLVETACQAALEQKMEPLEWNRWADFSLAV